MCPNKSLPESQRGMMDLALFRRVVDEASGFVHDMNIHHRGESLLHPQLGEMIAYAAQRGLMVKLHTNATLLDEDRSRQLIRSGLGVISFSFDGLDAETYQRFRRGACFEDTVANIRTFLRIKKESGSSRPQAVLEMMDLSGVDRRYALDGRRRFLQLFEGLPLDRLVIKPPHNFAGSIPLRPNPDDVPRRPTPCTLLWHSLVVLWDGHVVPCPQDFFAKLVLGTVEEQTLADIFNSPRLVALRQDMLSGQLAEDIPCARCDLIRRRTILGVPIQSIKYLQR
jgi:radical SAM protein with 4Fe4S-binding SPASM domain